MGLGRGWRVQDEIDEVIVHPKQVPYNLRLGPCCKTRRTVIIEAVHTLAFMRLIFTVYVPGPAATREGGFTGAQRQGWVSCQLDSSID
ncbi:MAG: hypothetical protein U0930_05375 [Pirellulales bacterium]